MTVGDVGIRRSARALERHRHHRDRQRRGVAADDVDLQALLLREGGQRQQGEQQQCKGRGEATQRACHRESRGES